MKTDISIRPVGSFLVIADDVRAELPDFVDKPNRLWSNEFCVAVGTLVDVDGPTHLRVVESDIPSDLKLAFDGEIFTPNRLVTVSDAHFNTFASVRVPTDRVRIKILTNDPREPDQVMIKMLRPLSR